MLALPVDTDQIVITASRGAEAEAETAASVIIINSERIERLGEPLVPALLRLTPSAAVAVSGPAGSLTEVRIRGAEANHTLLFIDGIRANDPASAAADSPGASSRPLMATTPPTACDPHSADCGPRTTSIREARSAFKSSKRAKSPVAGSLARMPSINSKV